MVQSIEDRIWAMPGLTSRQKANVVVAIHRGSRKAPMTREERQGVALVGVIHVRPMGVAECARINRMALKAESDTKRASTYPPPCCAGGADKRSC